ncbi:MAG: hypothetical protein ABI165_03235 [Bryobacteraceae bacterium]
MLGVFLVLLSPACRAQRYFFAALGGPSTLSADAATRLDSINAVSLYKPENGPAVNLAGGVHLNDWFSIQGNYVWNQNRLAIAEIQGPSSLEQDRRSSENGAIADLLLYFRSRRSRIRPYLSAGTGAVRIGSTSAGPVRGMLSPVPPQTGAVKVPLRVAVGIDLLWRRGWGFRYSFSETMTRNPFSAALDPAGSRRLANFQNLFGLVKYF